MRLYSSVPLAQAAPLPWQDGNVKAVAAAVMVLLVMSAGATMLASFKKRRTSDLANDGVKVGICLLVFAIAPGAIAFGDRLVSYFIG